MTKHAELHNFLAQSQQLLRQKDRFGDLESNVTFSQPSPEQINIVQQLILNFAINPLENIDNLLPNRQILQFIPESFVNQLSQTQFYMNLHRLLENQETGFKAMFIISSMISPISHFTMPMITFSYGQTILNKLEIILKSCNTDDMIVASEECLVQILNIKNESMKIIFPRWNISGAMTRRAFRDLKNPFLFHLAIKVLLKILDVPEIRSFDVKSFAETAVLLDYLPNIILADIIFLLAKVIKNFALHDRNATRTFASKNLTDRIIQLIQSSNHTIRVNALNAIIQLSLGCPEPIDMLLSKNLLKILMAIAKENENEIEIVLNAVYGITQYGPRFVEIICDEGFVDLLTFAISNGSIDAQRAAVILASNIMCFGSFKEIIMVLTTPILTTIVEFLDEDYSEKISYAIIDGMIKGLDAEAEALSSDLKNALSNEQFTIILQNFISSDDHELSNIARYLLEKLSKSI
ncbi:hypothetical protein TRFO_26332 [Tritrichomonas foetus]|uniref:Uncharacterized protein n=1 Tax=Tritrichomonas foetus TaxID=1144522 RepID=A0A1J4K3R5_9EUKA|nr:hypothetical protein TRFO_26332 [Tritrichomonas foetus]|eukprot:OHT05827.1 hypothetical protein TRFO_26332 [Tritrichomonas foetus]